MELQDPSLHIAPDIEYEYIDVKGRSQHFTTGERGGGVFQFNTHTEWRSQKALASSCKSFLRYERRWLDFLLKYFPVSARARIYPWHLAYNTKAKTISFGWICISIFCLCIIKAEFWIGAVSLSFADILLCVPQYRCTCEIPRRLSGGICARCSRPLPWRFVLLVFVLAHRDSF